MLYEVKLLFKTSNSCRYLCELFIDYVICILSRYQGRGCINVWHTNIFFFGNLKNCAGIQTCQNMECPSIFLCKCLDWQSSCAFFYYIKIGGSGRINFSNRQRGPIEILFWGTYWRCLCNQTQSYWARWEVVATPLLVLYRTMWIVPTLHSG